MSREFIYRIWSIKEKKYIMTGSLYGVEGITHLTGCFNRNEHIIEEYTGLDDINGNRIFENDILYFTARYKQKGNVPVIYYGGSFGCVVTDDSDFKEFWNLSHIVQQYYPKIVATIHDNDLVP
jgi:hypothetical protein